MQETVDILNEFIDAIKNDLINSMQANGRYATGDTIKALEELNREDYAALLAPAYIDALEYGRGPTSAGAAKADPPLIDRIKAWCDAKGIDQKYAWAIKKNIDKVGYQGKQGVLSEPLSDNNVNSKIDLVMEKIADNKATEILDLFDNLKY